MKSILLTLFFLFFSQLLVAQALQIDSVGTVPSTCENNGEIIVEASGGDSSGTGYVFALIAPSVELRPNQSSNTFSALSPGSYTVQVIDNMGTIVTEENVIIEDQYEEPVISSVDGTTAECPGEDEGTATVNVTGGSAIPLSYTLFDLAGNIIAGPQSSNVFTDLPDGDYVARVEDACEIVFNFGVTLEVVIEDLDFRNFDRFERTCDESTARFRLFDNINPTDYVITDASGIVVDSGTITNGSQADITFPNEDGLLLTVTDACGRVVTENLDEEEYIVDPVVSSSGCGSSIDFNLSRELDCAAQYCYKLVSETMFTCVATEITPVLPAGDYDVRLIVVVKYLIVQ